ncbi:MAG TPA: TrmJ/YjtD family RNA methyltransferase [Candidatus Korarchaeota archaeon]|nr:TrmJ/YjtD family RNA methyltransferase [Candidatus Korarchaeota archaeon]
MYGLPDIRVVLVEPENASNVGMIARVMKNFGFSDLYMVRPAFSSFSKAYSTAMHARELLYKAKICVELEEALEGADLIIGTTAKPGRRSIIRRSVELSEYVRELRWDAKYAIVLGRESTGLRVDELSKCDVVLTIAADPAYPTLNVVNAAAIILYKFYIWSRKLEQTIKPVKRSTREMMVKYISEIVHNLPLPNHKKERALALISRIISRSYPCGISEGEAAYLLGLVRMIRDIVTGGDHV